MDSSMTLAWSAGLIRDTASNSAFVKDAWARVPLELLADTLWLVSGSPGWRVWDGADARARLDSLGTVLNDPIDGLDTAMVKPGSATDPANTIPSLSQRQRAADEIQSILSNAPRQVADNATRERLSKKISALAETVRIAKELTVSVTILPPSEGQAAVIHLPGISNQRAFSARFVVRDNQGRRSGIASPIFLWGTRPNRVGLTAPGFRPADLTPGAGTIEFISLFELDVNRMRRDYLGE